MAINEHASTAPAVDTDESGASTSDDGPRYRTFELPREAPILSGWLDGVWRFVSYLDASGHGGDDTFYGVVHPMYDDIDRMWADTYRQARNRWIRGRFPFPRENNHWSNPIEDVHRTTTSWGGSAISSSSRGFYANIKTSGRASFRQFLDGSGVVNYHGETAMVRTRSGLLLETSEDLKVISGGRWFASYRRPPSAPSRFSNRRRRTPLPTYDARLPLNSISEMDGTGDLRDIIKVETGGGNAYVHYLDGTRVVVVSDDTANSRDDRKAGFVVEDEAETFPPVEQAERLLMPEAVERLHDKGMSVVTSDQFASGADFQHGLCGNVIVRQGEWYLVPARFTPRRHDGEWHFPAMNSHNPASPVALKGLRSSPAFHELRALGRMKNVATKTVHIDWLYETYERLDSHQARDIAYDDLMRPVVRGTFRHVDNEHAQLNLGDEWHTLFENTRDVTVFSMRRGRYASGGSGSGMRVE